MFLEALEDRAMLAGLAYQNPVNHFDVNIDGVANGQDAWVLHLELQAWGERSLSNPNGPVNLFVDVNGDYRRSLIDQEMLLRKLNGTLDEMLDPELLDALIKDQDGELSSSDLSGLDSGGGGMSTMSCPSISLNPVGNVNEGSALSLTGTVSPAGSYFFTANINWGQSPGSYSMGYVGTSPSGAFSIPHMYFDDGISPGNGTPQDIETISLSATINGCPVAANTTATINNLPPVPGLVLVNGNNPQGGPRWQISGTIQDAAMSERHTVTIDWGDNSPPTVVSDLPTNTYFSREHDYAPRQIHEGTLPYYPTVTIVDDDTGSALWEPQVPQYVFDLDNDADNSWAIDGDDDPIEDTPPGRFVNPNWDDDIGNGVLDLNEAPVSGEDDLEPLMVGWEPRPDFDYSNWHLTLEVLPLSASGALWEAPEKTGVPTPFSQRLAI